MYNCTNNIRVGIVNVDIVNAGKRKLSITFVSAKGTANNIRVGKRKLSITFVSAKGKANEFAITFVTAKGTATNLIKNNDQQKENHQLRKK